MSKPQEISTVASAQEKLTSPNVLVTRSFYGICSMQVCAHKNATDDEILAVCNGENPSGTSNGWAKVVRESEGDDSLFAGPTKAPVVCADDPERLHIIVNC